MKLEDIMSKVAESKALTGGIKHIIAASEHFLWPNITPFQDVIEGPGSSARAVEILRLNKCTKALIVTDKVLVKLGVLKTMTDAMDKAGFPYAIFDGVEPNPTIENIEAAYALYKSEGCDCAVAFGGGSSIDCAKVALCNAARPKLSVEQLGRAMGYFPVTFAGQWKKVPFLMAIPTTAGTGSESTVAAVVSNVRTDQKITISDTAMRPKAVILDAALAAGLPPKATAETALDAFCHCLEGYINRSHNPRADEYAIRGMRLVKENIDAAYKDGKNLEARQALCQAAYFGGQTLNFEFTGYVHPFCHKLGAKYHLVHGRAIGSVLPIILEEYGDLTQGRLARAGVLVGISDPNASEAEQAKQIIAWIREYCGKFEIPEFIPEIKDEHFDEIADSIMLEMIIYPTYAVYSREEIFAILRKIRGDK